MTGTSAEALLSSMTAGRLNLWFRRKLPGLRFLPWRYRLAGSVAAADEVPTTLPPRTATVVLARSEPSWLAFDCPRHPEERILLNLSHSRKPWWDLRTGKTVTLFPSVDAFHSGERCHFWLNAGRVNWVQDE